MNRATGFTGKQMARYKIILAYDGTEFSGFQRQDVHRSVQAVFEESLKKIGWQGSSILAAGRTDSGVHAEGQVVAFDLQWQHSLLDLKNAINSVLPLDMAVHQVSEVSAEFHPRYDARTRNYRYDIFCEAQRNPIRERYAWRVWPMPELSLLQAAAQEFIGELDFSFLGSAPREHGSTVRKVFSANWEQTGEERFQYFVSANAFLYHMVRRMVSISIEIALNKVETGIIKKYKEGSVPGMIQGLAPPNGLFLTEVTYDE